MSTFIPVTQCNTCRQIKPRTEFYSINRHRQCKVCQNAANKVWHAKNPGAHSRFSKKAKLKSKYGLTVEAHTAMLQVQFYKCAACGDKFELENKWEQPCVDHDHETGKVRELLCRRCNVTLGHVEDDVGRLEKLIAYLRRHQSITPI
jgi:hypothetical protein